jgi:hypothetical protein
MKLKELVLLSTLFLLTANAYAETKYFDVPFGISSIGTTEKLEGITTRTVFALNGVGNTIEITKTEYPNRNSVYHYDFSLVLVERRSIYAPVRGRFSIDGDIEEFYEDSPYYGSDYNLSSWLLSDSFISKLKACQNLAIEFGGKVYRFSEKPLEQIKDFLTIP